jgi:type II secretory pathway predicted ATPase ExeA
MLDRHAAHGEAAARITWTVTEKALGVITGEVGPGKTVSVRTVLAGLDNSRHTIILHASRPSACTRRKVRQEVSRPRGAGR